MAAVGTTTSAIDSRDRDNLNPLAAAPAVRRSGPARGRFNRGSNPLNPGRNWERSHKRSWAVKPAPESAARKWLCEDRREMVLPPPEGGFLPGALLFKPEDASPPRSDT
jgi:hypothetical protein